MQNIRWTEEELKRILIDVDDDISGNLVKKYPGGCMTFFIRGNDGTFAPPVVLHTPDIIEDVGDIEPTLDRILIDWNYYHADCNILNHYGKTYTHNIDCKDRMIYEGDVVEVTDYMRGIKYEGIVIAEDDEYLIMPTIEEFKNGMHFEKSGLESFRKVYRKIVRSTQPVKAKKKEQ